MGQIPDAAPLRNPYDPGIPALGNVGATRRSQAKQRHLRPRRMSAQGCGHYIRRPAPTSATCLIGVLVENLQRPVCRASQLLDYPSPWRTHESSGPSGQFRIDASAATPNPAKMSAAPMRTTFIGTIRVIFSPRNTAGTFAIIIPRVVPAVTIATC